MPRLIWVFAGRKVQVILLVLSCCGSFQVVSYLASCLHVKHCDDLAFGRESWSLSLLVHLGRVKRIWYLSPMRAAKVQASLRIRAVSPEPPLLAHTSSQSRGTFRQKARSLVPPNGWACAVTICYDGMLVDGAHLLVYLVCVSFCLFPLRRWAIGWLAELWFCTPWTFHLPFPCN